MSEEKNLDTAGGGLGPLGKFAIEAGPLIVFFAGNALFDIYVGTSAFMVATVISLVAAYVLERRIAMMPLVSAVFVLIFGGLTIWFNDDTFIKLKPTLVSILFGVVLLVGVARGAAPLKMLLGHVMEMTPEGWRTMTIRWGLFFFFLAGLNEAVWRNVSTDTWVSFKVFGLLPLTMVFAITQTLLMQKHMISDEDDEPSD